MPVPVLRYASSALWMAPPEIIGSSGAMQRLREARSFVQSLDRDTRQRLPARPEREMSR